MLVKLVTSWLVTIGVVATASSPAPITMTRLSELIIRLAGGTACAVSLLVSNCLQASLAPSTPPPALIGATPDRQPARAWVPWWALSPLKGKITPMFSGPPEPGVAVPAVALHAARVIVTAATAARVFRNEGRPPAMRTSASMYHLRHEAPPLHSGRAPLRHAAFTGGLVEHARPVWTSSVHPLHYV